MHWRWYHTLIVLAWAGLALLGQLLAGVPGGPAAAAGVITGATVGALVVVWVLGSCWQWAVRQVRRDRD